MKTLSIVIFFVLSGFYSKAQDDFMSISLNSTTNVFLSKLQQKGFKTIRSKNNDIKLYNGKFLGKDAIIGVMLTPVSRLIFGVTVIYRNEYDYIDDNTDETYFNLKDLLDAKYGSSITDTATITKYYLLEKYARVSAWVKKPNQIVYLAILNGNCSIIYMRIDKIKKYIDETKKITNSQI